MSGLRADEDASPWLGCPLGGRAAKEGRQGFGRLLLLPTIAPHAPVQPGSRQALFLMY